MLGEVHMSPKSRLMIWLPVMVILGSGALFLAAAITAVIARRPAVHMVCLGIGLLAVMGMLSACHLRKTTITVLILFPSIYLLLIRMVEPTWLLNARFLGAVAVCLLFANSLNMLLRFEAFDRLLTAVGFFSVAGILLVTAKMALLTEAFGRARSCRTGRGLRFLRHDCARLERQRDRGS
jgi:hypothetical protein